MFAPLHANLPLGVGVRGSGGGGGAATAAAAHSVVLYLLLSASCRPRSLAGGSPETP